VPHDRQARFDPQLIAKYQRRLPEFDDKIISMYARGMSTRETVGHLRELYGIDVSADLISVVTDAVSAVRWAGSAGGGSAGEKIPH
jgi:putative transposase